jgi:hypothetical protein
LPRVAHFENAFGRVRARGCNTDVRNSSLARVLLRVRLRPAAHLDGLSPGQPVPTDPVVRMRALIWRNLRDASDLRIKKKRAALFGVTVPVSAAKALGQIKIGVDNIGIGRYS